jgi:hypothetical protein
VDFGAFVQCSVKMNNKFMARGCAHKILVISFILSFVPCLCVNSCLLFGFQEKLATLNHVVLLADFAMAMKQKLQDINLHSFNNFQMKVGKLETKFYFTLF